MSPPAKGRLAAILYGDLVGYSALHGWDEAAAAKRLAAWRDLLAAEVAAGNGRLVEAAGEGAVAEFTGAGQAFACAERALRRVATRNAGLAAGDRFEVTFGLAVGDVTEEGGDLLGPAVQTAVAAHTLADPGGIALTAVAYAHVAVQAVVRGTMLRPRRFTNLPDPVRVFVVPPPGVSYPMWVLRKRKLAPALAAVAAAAFLGPRMVPEAPPAPAAPAAAAPAPGRVEQVLMTFPTTDYVSAYDGGGSTLAFSIVPGPDAQPRLKLVLGGGHGWWGATISRSFDLSAFDAFVITCRSDGGTGFRIMIKDDDEAWTAPARSGTVEGPVTIPFASFPFTPDPKKPGNGVLDRDKVREIQLIHAGTAVSDTIWIASLAVSGPSPAR